MHNHFDRVQINIYLAILETTFFTIIFNFLQFSQVTSCVWSNITFTWIHYWPFYYYIEITTYHLVNCKNVMNIFVSLHLLIYNQSRWAIFHNQYMKDSKQTILMLFKSDTDEKERVGDLSNWCHTRVLPPSQCLHWTKITYQIRHVQKASKEMEMKKLSLTYPNILQAFST